MAERPILFSAPMVRAILDGRKTVTRRVVKPQPDYVGAGFAARSTPDDMRLGRLGEVIRCPYGAPGDRLWVRETHAIFSAYGQHREDGTRWGPWGGLPTVVSPDGSQIAYFREGFDRCDPGRWRPSIHMPRWASRITLEVTAVRVERLQDITPEQAVAEGMVSHMREHDAVVDLRQQFADLWDGLAKPGTTWADNPWVWAVEFRRVEGTP